MQLQKNNKSVKICKRRNKRQRQNKWKDECGSNGKKTLWKY